MVGWWIGGARGKRGGAWSAGDAGRRRGKLLNTLTLRRYHHHQRYQSSPSSLNYLIPA